MSEFFCPICKKKVTSEEEVMKCQECDVNMLKKAEISMTLEGKKIVGVYFDTEEGDAIQIDGPTDFWKDAGVIFLMLDDGSIIRAWNSEWGGISYYPKTDVDVEAFWKDYSYRSNKDTERIKKYEEEKRRRGGKFR